MMFYLLLTWMYCMLSFLKKFLPLVFLPLLLLKNSYAQEPTFNIGAGIYDITGPAAEINMMGYAQIDQMTSGIHNRLWSRAFIFQDLKTHKSLIFVSADLGMIFHSIKSGVIAELKRVYGNIYRFDNVMLSATHTHSGPGGYAYRTLFNITSRGFEKKNYQTIVEGIVQSIIRAHNNLQLGYISLGQAQLLNTTKNRSLKAYLKNPDQERQLYDHNTDKSVLQLNLFNQYNSPIGVINWHAVHGVSMSNKNTLISGDNKGYASYLFEKKMQTNYLASKTFVAAFAQSNEGDASPNIFTDDANGQCLQFDCPDIRHMQLIGTRQFEKASELFEQSTTIVEPTLDTRFKYIDMANQVIQAPYSLEEQPHQTTKAALGYAFGAGTTDGLGLTPLFHQGQLKGSRYVNLVRNTIKRPTKEITQLQAPKPILLAVGLNKPNWVSHILPIQLFKLGQLLIAGVPAEFTTVAGRRLKEQLLQQFGSEAKYVVIAGLANDYSGYVTTPEEYQQQNYEGGFTLFGPWTHEAYLQGFSELGNDMRQNKISKTTIEPEQISEKPFSLITPVLFDDRPPSATFGSPHDNPKKSYQKGEVVHVSFWAGHPRNSFQTMKSFLEVQYYDVDHWQPIFYDWDPSTIYRWQRIGVSYSLSHIYWQIPHDTKPGTYRIVHHGHYKYGWNQSVYSYNGISNIFSVLSSNESH